MTSNPVPISDDILYRQGDVELSVRPERVLTYRHDGETMRKTFRAGLSEGSGDFIDQEAA